jgi:hypothetical protein
MRVNSTKLPVAGQPDHHPPSNWTTTSAGGSKTLWEIGDIVKLVEAAEAKIGELVIPAEASFRPLAFEAIGDGGANLVQGVENDRRRDFRANADVGAEPERARYPFSRVLSDRLPKKFRRASSLDRVEETINLRLIIGQRGLPAATNGARKKSHYNFMRK